MSPLRIVYDTELYDAIRSESAGSKRFWIASPYLGKLACNVFDRSFLEATDRRILTNIESGYVDRTEITRLFDWAPNGTKTLSTLHAKLYIFDRVAIITSANLSQRAFTLNREAGVVLYDPKALLRVNRLYGKLFSDAQQLTKAMIASIGSRSSDGDPSRSRKSAKPHTKIEQWIIPGPSPGADFPEAAITFESRERISGLQVERAYRLVRRLRLRRVDWVHWVKGVRTARKVYPVGAVFDQSESAGSKTENWAIGAKRSLAKVVGVERLQNESIVIFRRLCRYTVTPRILAAAKEQRVFRGDPDPFQLTQFARLISTRRS